MNISIVKIVGENTQSEPSLYFAKIFEQLFKLVHADTLLQFRV